MRILRTLLASLVLIVVGGVLLAAATDRFHAFTSETARRVRIRQQHPRVPDVLLETQSGARIKLGDLRGKWLLVDFIYTRCMTYCSVLGGEFAQLQTRLATPLAQGKLQLLSISFDPAHDAPPQLAGYLNRFRDHGNGWLAARPLDTAGLTELKQIFGITVIPDRLGGFVHNTGIELVNPQGQLVDIFDPGNPGHIGKTVMQYLER
ncbi:MAG TPA: SCO family protein [Gammaproteobacteria bacterium]|nr:SCO family protein [Gammaproteobacteria bacterium]